MPRSFRLATFATFATFATLPAVLGACVASAPPTHLAPQVQLGPGQRTRPQRVLVLAASCGSVDYRCPREYGDTVDGIVRGGMEFAGYALVDTADLRNVTRQRHETHETERTTSASRTDTTTERPLDFDDHSTTVARSESETTHSVVDLDGPAFEDLTVAERRDLLREAGADAVLVVRVVVGATTGVWTPDQNVEVLIKLGVDDGGTMAWASRCMASSEQFSNVRSALENAARCAVSGATGH